MINQRISRLGLCETRWKQSGKLQPLSDQTILYSSHEDKRAPHTECVAIIISKEVQGALISWEAVSPRIVSPRYTTKRKNINITVIQCYAPTNDALDDKKEEFYDQLPSVVNRQSDKDNTLLMEDLNAKIGDVNTGYEQFMGAHGLGRMDKTEKCLQTSVYKTV